MFFGGIIMENEYSLSDFYEYLTRFGKVNSHSRTNYMSWMAFIAKNNEIPTELTDEEISKILASENEKRVSRNIYKTEKDMGNFRSTLRKYREFLLFNLNDKKAKEIDNEIESIKSNKSISKTEKESIIVSRIGQGDFRKRLIQYWHGCSISRFRKYDILVASHIKPWRDSTNEERLDTFNGLLLLPNYDKLFDKGYISFDFDGKIIFSKFISTEDKEILGMTNDISLIKVDDKHKKYLEYHKDKCLMR